jgi:hypothetical protein
MSYLTKIIQQVNEATRKEREENANKLKAVEMQTKAYKDALKVCKEAEEALKMARGKAEDVRVMVRDEAEKWCSQAVAEARVMILFEEEYTAEEIAKRAKLTTEEVKKILKSKKMSR